LTKEKSKKVQKKCIFLHFSTHLQHFVIKKRRFFDTEAPFLVRTEVPIAVVKTDAEGKHADGDACFARPAAAIEHLHHAEIGEEAYQHD